MHRGQWRPRKYCKYQPAEQKRLQSGRGCFFFFLKDLCQKNPNLHCASVIVLGLLHFLKIYTNPHDPWWAKKYENKPLKQTWWYSNVAFNRNKGTFAWHKLGGAFVSKTCRRSGIIMVGCLARMRRSTWNKYHFNVHKKSDGKCKNYTNITQVGSDQVKKKKETTGFVMFLFLSCNKCTNSPMTLL